jgi:hypothetical protein
MQRKLVLTIYNPYYLYSIAPILRMSSILDT